MRLAFRFLQSPRGDAERAQERVFGCVSAASLCAMSFERKEPQAEVEVATSVPKSGGILRESGFFGARVLGSLTCRLSRLSRLARLSAWCEDLMLVLWKEARRDWQLPLLHFQATEEVEEERGRGGRHQSVFDEHRLIAEWIVLLQMS